MRRLGLVSALLLSSGTLVAQEYGGPVWGGSGGTASYNLDCGNTGILVGMYGKVGLWIDQIGIICQTVKADGSLGASYIKGPVGGAGGTSATARCPAGQAVGWVAVRAGSYVEYVRLYCWAWVASTRRLNWSSSSFRELGQPKTTLGYARCPDEMVGKVFRGKSGSYIDSLQFVCDAYNQ